MYERKNYTMDENLNNLPLDNDEEINGADEELLQQSDAGTQEETEAADDYIPAWARDNDEDNIITFAEDEEDVTEDEQVAEEESFTEVPKKKNGKTAAILSVVIVVILAALIAVGYFMISKRNPYNKLGYINTSGRTIGDLASEIGFATLDEFLAEYSLPADMPADTEEAAAYYSIPVKKIVEMYGYGSIDELKEICGLGEDVTEDMTWGEAEAKILLKNYIGEEGFEEFKQEFGLGEDITLETKWGEVRNIVDQKRLEMRLEAEKAQAEGVTQSEGDVAETETAQEPEANAEGEAAAE